MAEAWRPVPGWPCEASYSGSIRTTLRGLPYVLTPHPDRKGYLKVSVGGRTARVHKLVALAWLSPPRKGKTQVRHLDGDKENCTAWNLKWGDQADQEQDKRHAGTRSRAKRETISGAESRVERGTGLNGSERKEKEGIKTSAPWAPRTRTTRT